MSREAYGPDDYFEQAKGLISHASARNGMDDKLIALAKVDLVQ